MLLVEVYDYIFIFMTNQNTATDSGWEKLRQQAQAIALNEAVLKNIATRCIVDCQSFAQSLAVMLSTPLDHAQLRSDELRAVFEDVYAANPQLPSIAMIDLHSVLKFDPAANDLVTPFLFFKGYKAIQIHRVAHALWQQGRKSMAYFLQSQSAASFGVDIHPAASFGSGITFDHATSIVIGETARMGNNILVLHNVTLGGKGDQRGERHPIIEDDVVIGAGAKILGRVTIGRGAFIAAGGLVLQDVAPGTTVAGVPAKVIQSREIER